MSAAAQQPSWRCGSLDGATADAAAAASFETAARGERRLADMSPTLPPTDWPVSATLWLSILHKRIKFLHIPKAGGTSVEHEDAHAPKLYAAEVWAHAFVPDNSTFKRVNLRDRRMWIGFDTCRRRQFHAFAPFSPHHMTPHDLCVLGMCGLFNWYSGADTVYSGTDGVYRGADAVYCVMRDPVRRLASDVEYVRSTHGLWPLDKLHRFGDEATTLGLQNHSRAWPPACGCATPDCGITKIEDCPVSLRCYLALIRDHLRIVDRRMAAHTAALEAIANRTHRWYLPAPMKTLGYSEFFVHAQPQSRMILDRATGRPACNVVFRVDDLAAAGLSHLKQSRNPSAVDAVAAELAADAGLRKIFEEVYADDLRMWERLGRGEPATPAHLALGDVVSRFERRYPRVSRRELHGADVHVRLLRWAGGPRLHPLRRRHPGVRGPRAVRSSGTRGCRALWRRCASAAAATSVKVLPPARPRRVEPSKRDVPVRQVRGRALPPGRPGAVTGTGTTALTASATAARFRAPTRTARRRTTRAWLHRDGLDQK